MTHEEILKTAYSLDDFDYSSVKSPIAPRICALCGKEFIPFGRNRDKQRFCKRSHYLNCMICGKPVFQPRPTDRLSELKCTCSKECATKWRHMQTEAAMQDKYGVLNPSQVKEFRDKAKASNLAKMPQTVEKIKKTLTEKYGGMGTASPEIQAKVIATTRERYGVSNAAQSDEIRQKLSEICKSPEYQVKYTATAMANWGVNRPSKRPEVIDKMRNTVMEKYGVECVLQLDECREKLRQHNLETYGVENALFSEYGMQRAREGFIQHMRDHNNKISKLNQGVAEEFKKSFGIELEYEFMIGRKSFDFRVKDTNVLLEIDPSYTHSDLPNHWSGGVPADYQLNKTQIAEEAGYRCIHVFDWDNLTKIGEMLKPRDTVYARKCKVKKITNSDANIFIDRYHLQGKVNGTKYAYGLFLDDKLISVMTFGRPRYNKNYEWELLRLCTASEYNVIGGASKLFYQFVKEVNPSSIISYCDRAKFSGSVYTHLEFKLHHTSPPAKVWSKGTQYITDNLLRQRGYDQLFNADYGKGTSNEELMVENGWRSVYDCGQLVFEWKPS